LSFEFQNPHVIEGRSNDGVSDSPIFNISGEEKTKKNILADLNPQEVRLF